MACQLQPWALSVADLDFFESVGEHPEGAYGDESLSGIHAGRCLRQDGRIVHASI